MLSKIKKASRYIQEAFHIIGNLYSDYMLGNITVSIT